MLAIRSEAVDATEALSRFYAAHPNAARAIVDDRWDRAWGLYQQGDVRELDVHTDTVSVRAETTGKRAIGDVTSYTVNAKTLACTCPDAFYRGQGVPGFFCKHAWAVWVAVEFAERRPAARNLAADLNLMCACSYFGARGCLMHSTRDPRLVMAYQNGQRDAQDRKPVGVTLYGPYVRPLDTWPADEQEWYRAGHALASGRRAA